MSCRTSWTESRGDSLGDRCSNVGEGCACVKTYKGDSDLSCGSIPAMYPIFVLGHCRFHCNTQESQIASGYRSAFRLKSIFKLVSLEDYGHRSLKLKKGTSRKSISWKGNEICWYCCLTFPEVLVEVPWQHLTFRINETNMFQLSTTAWIIMDHPEWSCIIVNLMTPSFEKERQTHSFTPKRPPWHKHQLSPDPNSKLSEESALFIFSIDTVALIVKHVLWFWPFTQRKTNLQIIPPRPGFSHLQLRNIWSPSSQARDAQPQHFSWPRSILNEILLGPSNSLLFKEWL